MNTLQHLPDPGDPPCSHVDRDSYAELSTAAYAKIEVEYMEADDLLIDLMTIAYGAPAYPHYFEQLSKAENRHLSLAISTAHRKTAHWPFRRWNLKGFAREALAGWELRPMLPPVAAVMERPWSGSIDVRSQLRALGPRGEECAARLAPTWAQSVTDLPAIVASLTDQAAPDQSASQTRGATS